MTDPPMYNVASAILCRSLAIVRSLPLPGCGCALKSMVGTVLPAKSDSDVMLCLQYNRQITCVLILSSSDLSIRVGTITIVTKYYVTVTLGWHDSKVQLD